MKIQGYAAVFNRVIRPTIGAVFMARPGSFQIGNDLGLRFMHEDQFNDRLFASTKDRSLRLWQDAHGLAFEADIFDHRLEDLILSGRCCEMSASCDVRTSTRQQIEGEPVDVATALPLLEISIVAFGGCPGTGVWDAAAPDHQIAPRIAEVRKAWNCAVGSALNNRTGFLPVPVAGPDARVGKQAGGGAVSIAPRRPPSPPASVLALLGSQSIAQLVASTRRRFDSLAQRGAAGTFFNGFGEVPASVIEWLDAYESGELFPTAADKPIPAGAMEAYEAAMEART